MPPFCYDEIIEFPHFALRQPGRIFVPTGRASARVKTQRYVRYQNTVSLPCPQGLVPAFLHGPLWNQIHARAAAMQNAKTPR